MLFAEVQKHQLRILINAFVVSAHRLSVQRDCEKQEQTAHKLLDYRGHIAWCGMPRQFGAVTEKVKF